MVIIFRRKLLAAGGLVLLGLFIFMPSEAFLGAQRGVELCIKTVIPAMLPFMMLVFVLGRQGVRIPSWIAGLLMGFPSGAFCAFMERVSGHKGERGRKSSFNIALNNLPSGAFIVISTGIGIYHSAKIGWLLLGVLLISTFFCKLVCGCFASSTSLSPEPPKAFFMRLPRTNMLGTAEPLDKSNARKAPKRHEGAEASKRLMAEPLRVLPIICANIILFSSIICVLEKIGVPWVLLAPIEITNAISGCPPLPFTAGLLGFGGISVGAQTFMAIGSGVTAGIAPLGAITGLRRRGNGTFGRDYFMAKGLQGLVSGLLMYFFLLIGKTYFSAC